MYSRNDYRYYLERQLLVSDDYLAHYGVMGMKWGVRHDERRAALVSKRNANTAKISNYQNKLNTVGAQKRAAKAAKYQHKVDKLQKKASKAQQRLAKGKNLSKGDMKKLTKYESYKAKAAKNSVKNDKYQMKISQLQAKNAKLDKKIAKMDRPSRAGARAYQKGLNTLDKKMAKDYYTLKTSSNEKRLAKASSNYKSNQTAKTDTMKDAVSRGYSVKEKKGYVSRDARPLRTQALIGGFGMPGAAANIGINAYNYKKNGVTQYMPGTQYKVSKTKKGQTPGVTSQTRVVRGQEVSTFDAVAPTKKKKKR